MYLTKFHRCFIIYQKLNKDKTFNRMKNDQSHAFIIRTLNALSYIFSLQLNYCFISILQGRKLDCFGFLISVLLMFIDKNLAITVASIAL